MQDSQAILSRLVANESQVDKICQIAGIAGASIGVIHDGQVIYKHHHGFRNITTQEVADGSTLYGIGTCSEPFFAAVVGALASMKPWELGSLSWDEQVKEYLHAADVTELKFCPLFERHWDDAISNATLIDLLSHRTGLAEVLHAVSPWNGIPFIGDGDEYRDYLLNLDCRRTRQSETSFREKWLYNCHGYSIAGEVLKHRTGESLNSLLEEHVNKPLGLERTTTEPEFGKDTNIAKPYSALEDGTAFELELPPDLKGQLLEAATGVYSTLDDTLKFLQANLDALQNIDNPRDTSGPLKETSTIFSQHTPLLPPFLRERSYALGWARTQLPGKAGVMGDNIQILGLDKLPVIGEGMESRLLIYHQGSTVGYSPALYMFPETQSGIVVLTNSTALGDQADWIAQSLTQLLFDDSKKVNWVALAEHTRDRCLAKYTDMKKEISLMRKPGIPTGIYHHVGNYHSFAGDESVLGIKIRRKPNSDDTLRISFPKSGYRQAYDLRHLHDDVFEWALTPDENAKRGGRHVFNPKCFLVEFQPCWSLTVYPDGEEGRELSHHFLRKCDSGSDC